jgi:hypothetical protein
MPLRISKMPLGIVSVMVGPFAPARTLENRIVFLR